jgi:hypothetical protein
MDAKIKHLEMIQGVINRMASNSFMLKGWAVTLVAGIFALAAKDTNKLYFIITYVPILFFWGLDAYYLRQERLFRKLYNKVRKQNENEIVFSMNTNLPEFKCKQTTYADSLFSTTEIWFYLPLALLTLAVIILGLT